MCRMGPGNATKEEGQNHLHKKVRGKEMWLRMSVREMDGEKTEAVMSTAKITKRRRVQ